MGAIVGVIVLGIVYLAFRDKFDNLIEMGVATVTAVASIQGLIYLVILLGFGLIKIPKYFFYKALPEKRLDIALSTAKRLFD